jgi:hypothetical protein
LENVNKQPCDTEHLQHAKATMSLDLDLASNAKLFQLSVLEN